MMVYANGQDIARLVLGGLQSGAWVHEPEVLHVRPEQYLAGLDTWMRKLNLERDQLEGFVLVSGPGSATSLRTSHALVNAIAWAWHMPVFTVDKPDPMSDSELLPAIMQSLSTKNVLMSTGVLPVYVHTPNITATTRDALKRKLR